MIGLPHLITHLQGMTSSAAKITADSRQVQAGDIFFAYPVGHGPALRDGRQYISAALAAGAAAVVYDPKDTGSQYEAQPNCFPVEDLAVHAGELCAQWYGNPSKDLNVIGVTGTNGKTSITQWLAQSLDAPEHRVAILGTLGSGFIGSLEQTGYTTPDAPRLQTRLRELLDSGAKQIAMEVSSHALDQARVSGVAFKYAIFTNLTQDHLDYHGTMAEYAEAKAKLFQQPDLEHAIINFDDSFGRELAIQLLTKNNSKVWGYALSGAAFKGFEKFGNRLHRSYMKDCALSNLGYEAVLCCEEIGSDLTHLSVLGEFNLSNCLAVWTVLLAQGLTCAQAAKRLSKLRPVPGRMEIVPLNKNHPMVVVDYAHTPDALEKALSALRPIALQRGGKIWCVFGCGGDRDVGKRAQMGAIAQQFADHVIVTSDNPRSEAPETIIEMIRSGMRADAPNIQAITDRAAAIMAAVRHADTRDLVLVAGKGHESTQEINGKKFDFSDQEHIQLSAGGGI
jgi:UDP-N-acetylmuramoyl-L-alanyl-D-glutamate--2,6-diaminopimelate ligase